MNPTMQLHEQIQQCLVRQEFETAEQWASSYVKQAPASSAAWLLLGQALLGRGYGAMAQLAFQRAWLLDPEATWVRAVFAALKQSQAGPIREEIVELLKVKKVTVTAAVIAKNEERCIERCLNSLIGAFDEIVVMDSGSTDKTMEIVRRFPEVKLYETEWKDSFSQLRNETIPLLTSDWVLWIDADEVLYPDDAKHVREAAGLFDAFEQPVILQVWMANQYGRHFHQDFSQSRMFPLNRGLRYYGRVHNQIAPDGGLQERVNTVSRKVRIRLIHDGYDPSVWRGRQKGDRSFKLLQQMVDEEPLNPSGWFFYGRDCFNVGEYDRALAYLKEAERLALMTPAFSALGTVRMYMAQIRLQQQEWVEAMRLCEEVLQRSPDYPDARYYLAQAQMGQAREHLRQAQQAIVSYNEALPGYRGAIAPDAEIKAWKAGRHMAELAVRSGKLAEARDLYEHFIEQFPQVEPLQAGRQALNGKIEKLLAAPTVRQKPASE